MGARPVVTSDFDPLSPSLFLNLAVGLPAPYPVFGEHAGERMIDKIFQGE